MEFFQFWVSRNLEAKQLFIVDGERDSNFLRKIDVLDRGFSHAWS